MKSIALTIHRNNWVVHQMEDLDEESRVSVGIQHCKLRRAWTDVKDLTLGPQVIAYFTLSLPSSALLNQNVHLLKGNVNAMRRQWKK
jgi:hypothetical protein